MLPFQWNYFFVLFGWVLRGWGTGFFNPVSKNTEKNFACILYLDMWILMEPSILAQSLVGYAVRTRIVRAECLAFSYKIR
jgi:hypothetical protein